jgi:hypothetical protein
MVAEGWEGDGDGSLLPWTRQRLLCSALLRTVTVADGGGIESDYGPAARKRYRDACRRQAFHLWLCPPHPTVKTQQIQYAFYSLEACSETGRRSMSVVVLWSLIPRARCRTGLGERRLPVELAAASLGRYGRGWGGRGRGRGDGTPGGAVGRPWRTAKLSPSPASLDRLPERGVPPRPRPRPRPSRRRDHQGSRVAPAMVIPMAEEDTMVVPVEEELPSRWSGSGRRKPDLVFPATSSLA